MASNDIPDEMQCKICKKRYEDPKLLSCLHTYCKACLERRVQTHHGTLCCPVCLNKVTFSEYSDVKNLHSNFMVNDRLQDLSSQQCEGCERVTATLFCIECSDFLCSDCVKKHKQACLTKNHLVISINADATFKSPTCAIHTQELMFCKQCKKPVCSLCDEHNEHLKTPLEEAVNNTKSKINTLLIAAQEKTRILEEKLSEVHASKENLYSKVEQANNEIEEVFERITMVVEQREKYLQEKLGRMHDQKSKELKSKELALRNDRAQVSNSCKFAKKLEKSDNKAMVLHTSELTCARLKDLSKKEDDAVKEIAENGIEYILEQKLVLDQLEICGDVLLQPNRSELNGTFPCGKSGCKTYEFIDCGTVEETRPEEEETRPEEEETRPEEEETRPEEEETRPEEEETRPEEEQTRRKQEETSNEISDEMQCKICKKRFEDPKLLSCLHTYCKACLEQKVQAHNGTLRCPVCLKKVTFSEYSDVKNLHSNFMVNDRLQDLLSSQQCEGNCETATSLCIECSDFLCSDCVEEHKRACLTKNHLVILINADATFKSPICAIHTEKALMFCKQCKKPVCESCDEHDEHLKTPLEEAVNDTQSKINTLLIAAQEKIPILQEKLDKIHASKLKLELKVDQVKKEIKETFAQILKAVEQRKDYLYKQVGPTHCPKIKELESKEDAIQLEMAQVSDSCNFAKKLEKSDNKAMVLHTSELTCARLRDLSGKEDDAVPEISENGIEFIVEEKLVLDQLEICGDVLLQPNRSELNGTFPCRKSECQTCKFIDSSSFISSSKYTFLIKHHFTCRSSNLIYCISCEKCKKLYIGQTVHSLHERFGQHRNSVENPKERERTHGVVEHFTSDGHDSSHMKVRALCPCPAEDETRPKDEEKRRKQEESRLIDKLGTLDPLGINKIP